MERRGKRGKKKKAEMEEEKEEGNAESFATSTPLVATCVLLVCERTSTMTTLHRECECTFSDYMKYRELARVEL